MSESEDNEDTFLLPLMKICPVAVSFLAGIFQMYALPLRLPQSLTEGGAGSWFKMLMLRIMLATVC